MKVAFRVDGGRAIGTGHVMRCLTLARALQDHGAEVVFLCRPHEGAPVDRIEARRIPVLDLEPPRGVEQDPSTWLGAAPSADVAESLSQLQRFGKVDWLVVDHYAIGREWEEEAAGEVDRILVIDDLADRPHHCDVLIDQTYQTDDSRYDSLVPTRCLRLLGPDYALLRPEFRLVRREREPIASLERVFVFFGGTDRTNQSGAVLEALGPWSDRLRVTVVTGRSNPHVSEIRRRGSTFRHCSVLVETNSMASLMVRADVGFGAGGVTTFERLAVGLPSIVVTIADNQEGVTRRLAREGYIDLLGRDADTTVGCLRQAFEALSLSDANRMSEHGMALVDGLGTERVARYLLGEVLPDVSSGSFPRSSSGMS